MRAALVCALFGHEKARLGFPGGLVLVGLSAPSIQVYRGLQISKS